MKKTVVFDFDGVIHSYTSGWKGATVIPDPPVEGIGDALKEIHDAGYEVVTYLRGVLMCLGKRPLKNGLTNT